jgi:hypothetical protein
MKPITAQWCLSDNLGDALMPWLVSKRAGQWPWYTATGPRWLLGGSILNWADQDCYVWGAGLADRSHKVNPKAKLLAVRGPESAKIAVACGCDKPLAIGDPALLTPLYTGAPREIVYEVGVFPHYADWRGPVSLYGDAEGVYVGNVLADRLETIKALNQCAEVVTSSLHVLILCDAYRIPNRYQHFGGEINGDGLKYQDYCESVGRTADTMATAAAVAERQRALGNLFVNWGGI